MIKELESIEFKGDIHKEEDISAIASFNRFLVIGSDETKKKIQVLKKIEDNSYKVSHDIKLPVSEGSDKEEFDIEGMEIGKDNTLFVIGSHSLKRKKVKPEKTYEENRERIATVEPEDKRNRIFKLTLDSETGELNGSIESINIKETILQDKVLKIFTQIPSKENGIDIEGIAVDGDQLYLGFRGPVLRLNYVPVVVTKFDNPSDYEIRYVNLGGNGIRDLTQVKDGFLMISGPVGDGEGSYQLYFWDGSDSIPGRDKQKEAQISLLGKIPSPRGAKAEGITVMEEISSVYKVIIVYDGLPNGAATLFQVTKPALS
ncbi:MAG: DUF3616 domain-containing protein [Prochloraceae cyanobacterium]|nr:DUF3616 domain-containing protein [Prochloraceae cyanobacterium]